MSEKYYGWYYEFGEYDPEHAPEEFVGMVYRIQNLDTNQKYIGKKLFWNRRKTKVKTKAGGTKQSMLPKSLTGRVTMVQTSNFKSKSKKSVVINTTEKS